MGTSFAGGGVGRLESGMQEAKYWSSSSSVISSKSESLRTESAGVPILTRISNNKGFRIACQWFIVLRIKIRCGCRESFDQARSLESRPMGEEEKRFSK